MPDFSSLFQLREAKPIRVGSQKVTVVSKALVLKVPGLPVGLVWNRPSAVRVETEGAGEVTLPVHDETRRLQILLLAFGILGSLFLGAVLRHRSI
jgi:hypothetical protein